jgi:hypothetical protein
LYLLPGAVFGLRNVFVVIGRKMIDESIAGGELGFIVEVPGGACTGNKNAWVFYQVLFGAKMKIGPEALFVGKSGLVEVAEPGLGVFSYLFLGLCCRAQQ